MDTATEHDLIGELLGLKAAGTAFLDEDVTSSAVRRYSGADHFLQERDRIFRRLPLIAAHASELPGNNAFLCRQVAGLPVLLTRDGEGTVHGFLNVCRHRGSRLVTEEAGCKRRFSCPYHAWTWDNRGDLKGIPHGDQGFPGLDRGDLGLRRLACVERHGWIWLSAAPGDEIDTAAWLDGLAADFDWLGAEALKVGRTDAQDRKVNWKILVEGGIEAYHFRVAHRETIGPYFQDNLSSYQCFGPHIRSILPRASLAGLADAPRKTWSLRAHANLVYSILPLSQLLVQQDHIVWIHLEPLAADRTRIRLSTLIPADADPDDAEAARHWRVNHDITLRTLSEDFDIGEGIQSGLDTGANAHLTFGRFEGALDRFNRTVDGYLA